VGWGFGCGAGAGLLWLVAQFPAPLRWLTWSVL